MPAVAPAPRFEPHNRVGGKFRIRRRLATGGMGEVWVARNEATGADVALKVLRRADADARKDLHIDERFRREARLSATLSHRNIVKVFDLIEEADGTMVLVMELLRGETLQDCLERDGPRAAREAAAIVIPILGALAHAHERGVVHRDVTPSNIFLAIDPDGRVTPKLVDFGIAKLASTEGDDSLPAVRTVDGRVLGTPRYMAPERIRGAEEVDGRSDVFAAAVVLYEAMTGVSPFAASSASASLAAVLERHIDPDPRIDPRLWIEIRRALSKRPYERHSTAAEFATALREALGEPEGALEASLRRAPLPPGWDEVTGPAESGPRRSFEGQSVAVVVRPNRRPLGWLLAGLFVALSLGILAVAWRGPGSSQRTAAATSVTPAAAAPTAVPPPTAILPPTATTSPTPTATPPAPQDPPRLQRTHPPASKPRAIATTPGF